MKPIHHFILSSIFLCLTATQCHKNASPADNPYGLPNATQTGAGIFACLINGRNFIAHYDGTWSWAQYAGDSIGVIGSPKLDIFENIGFEVIANPVVVGAYNIDGSVTRGYFAADSTCLGTSFNITSSNATSGTIQLTKIDTVNKIISGTFHCIFPIPSCDTLNVTEGRFDYRYY